MSTLNPGPDEVIDLELCPPEAYGALGRLAILVLRDLVSTLPKCDTDPAHGPATKARRRGSMRYCDSCALEEKRRAPMLDTVPDYPRAPALRKALFLLEKFQ
jgi:hypothetical protein